MSKMPNKGEVLMMSVNSKMHIAETLLDRELTYKERAAFIRIACSHRYEYGCPELNDYYHDQLEFFYKMDIDNLDNAMAEHIADCNLCQARAQILMLNEEMAARRASRNG